MLDISTVATTTGIAAVIQFGFYLLLRRPLEQVDTLRKEVQDLRDQDVAELRASQRDDGFKRKGIYERLEKIELTYRQNADCLRMYEDIKRIHEQSVASVIRLERVATGSENLVKRLDQIAVEQISLGKDMADLSARLDERKP